MYRGYFITYNNTPSHIMGVQIPTRPNKPVRESNVDSFEIPGRGTLYKDRKFYKNIEINIIFNFSNNANTWNDFSRSILSWLTGSGKLSFSDDPHFYYNVRKITVPEISRYLYELGEMEVIFECEPYEYSVDGEQPQINPEILYNSLNESNPIYVIEGEGVATLTVNDKSIIVNVGGKVTIDVDKRYAVNNNNVNITNTITGNRITELYLMSGENTITISNGFNVTIYPKWRF